MTDMSIRGINKVYPGGVRAVRNFNMDINKGEFIVFVGPSGCGKSTMLRMIAGLEPITDGDLFLKGKRINDVAPADRDIAMVFQNYALFGNMTVYGNMGLPLSIRHVNGDKIHLKVVEAATTVEMTPELNRKPGQLSGGQRQRVAIGRSLVRSPEVFLMDEPLSNLDAKLRGQTRKELAMLQDRLGTTFIYVTHDQVEAMTLADRIVIMNDGVIQQIGTPKEVYQTPANIFVGGFIGSPPMNFIQGKYLDGAFASDILNLTVSAVVKDSLNAYDRRSVVLGIRPEHFGFEKDSSRGIAANIDIVECLGNEYVIYFSIKSEHFRAQFPVGQMDFKVGDTMYISLDADNVSFFDSETTQRIGQGSL